MSEPTGGPGKVRALLPGSREHVPSTAILVGLTCALGLAGEAAAAPVTVGLGVGIDSPSFAVASEQSLELNPAGIALTVPVLLGGFRIEPELAWTPFDGTNGSYGVPSGPAPCPGLMHCEYLPIQEDYRVALGLTAGPAWSLGDRARLWAGPWAGLTFRSLGDGVPFRRDWSLGAIVGGELFLDDRFSFGLDLRAAYTSVDEGLYTVTTTPTQWGASTSHEFSRGWTADVDGVAAFRVYLD